MKDMGKHMKAIKKILEGKLDAAEMLTHISDVKMLTKRLSNDLKMLFPVGSDVGETDAKPLIWNKWDEFAKIAQSAAEIKPMPAVIKLTLSLPIKISVMSAKVATKIIARKNSGMTGSRIYSRNELNSGRNFFSVSS
jgi:cytochrome c556